MARIKFKTFENLKTLLGDLTPPKNEPVIVRDGSSDAVVGLGKKKRPKAQPVVVHKPGTNIKLKPSHLSERYEQPPPPMDLKAIGKFKAELDRHNLELVNHFIKRKLTFAESFNGEEPPSAEQQLLIDRFQTRYDDEFLRPLR